MTSAVALQSPSELLSGAAAWHALIAVLVLSLIAATLGWAIVLRDLPFFSHATGAGAYPVLVIGAIGGVAISVSALIGAVVLALVVALLGGSGSRPAPGGGRSVGAVGEAQAAGRRDALIGIVVVAALAIGSVIAAKSSGSVPEPESMLFGSAAAIDRAALFTIGAVAVLVFAAALTFSSVWLANGFDPGAAPQSSRLADGVLLLVVALAVGAAMPLTGALLASALLILPAASVRMFSKRASRIAPWTLLVATIESVIGLYFALNFELPAGAAIAFLAGGGFFVCAALRTLSDPRARQLRATAIGAALLASALLIAGCGGSTTASTGSHSSLQVVPLKVVATTPQMADIIRNVGGAAVQVKTLLGPNLDPHEYDPTQTDVARIRQANVVFRSGGAVDQWILPAMHEAEAPIPPVDLSRAAVLLPAADGGANAHWYLAPQNVARAAQKARDELIKADPAARETFRTNTTAYLDRIDRAERKFSSCAARVPRQANALLAEHNDFNYLADAFGLRIVAQLGQNGTGEPSAGRIARVTEQARRRGAGALIASSGEVSQVERAIASKLGIPLLALYSDNLTTGDDASTLLDAIGYDVARIVDGLTDGDVTCGDVK